MRGRAIAVATVSLVVGLALGALLSPPPADAVAKEIIQLQQQVSILLQNQQSMQNEMTQKFAVLQTLIGQAVDSQNQLASGVGSMQKTVQDLQANAGSQINTMGGQVQAVSDSVTDVKASVSKLSAQVATLQSTLQTVDAKVSAACSGAQPQQAAPNPTGANPTGPDQGSGAPASDAAAASQAPAAAAPQPQMPAGPAPPAELLYKNALRDFTAGNSTLATQEFRQYLQAYPQTDLASNSLFYLGEIAYSRGRYAEAIGQYDQVLNNYPSSFKRADARLKKAYALLKLKENGPAIAELRRVIRDNPGTEQAREAQARLRELGVRNE